MDHPHPKIIKAKQWTAYPWRSSMELKTISSLSTCVINIHKWPDPSQAALLIGKSQTKNGAGLVPEDNMLSGRSITHSCCWGGTIDSVTNVRGSDALYSVAVSANMIFEAHLQELNSKLLQWYLSYSVPGSVLLSVIRSSLFITQGNPVSAHQ